VPTVSFLFVDQVGSTAQLQTLGDERAAPVRRALFDITQSALAAHGGTLVDNTGDGVMATFNSAVAAVDCAAAIQQGVLRHNRRSAGAEAIEVRAGVHVGEPITDEAGRYFGMAVVIAARLCAAAEGGQVLVSDLVRALCASRDHLAFSPVGSLALKGVGPPVPAQALVLGAGEQVALLPLPDALVPTVPLSFVGRVAERAAIESAWGAVQTGARRVVLVAGEPGVGKTRLVTEAALEAYAQEAIVLFGRCDDELGFPYQPFVEALRHVVRHTPSSELFVRLGRYGGELRRLLPELASRADLADPIVSDPETERYRLFDAVANWLVALSAEAPVLFVVDDLQWASKPTLLLLRYVVRAFDLSHVCLVATYRPDGLGRGHPLPELLADLRRETGVDRVILHGLTEEDVLELLGGAGQHDADARGRDLAQLIHLETDGNAFFVAEVLRHLVESGEVLRHDDRWTFDRPMGELSIPDSVREVVGQRFARLSQHVHEVLETAAVAGPRLDVAVLAAAQDLSPDEILLTIDEAATAGLVRYESTGLPLFGHALIRTTLYDTLPLARRARLHRSIGAAIERVHEHGVDDYLPDLAYHFAHAAAAADISKAADYANRAGDRALAQLAHDEASRYYRQALDLLETGDVPADSRRARLLAALAEAQARAGDVGYRSTMLEAAQLARTVGDIDLFARAALVRSRIGFGSVEAEEERVRLLEEALATLPPTDSPIRARILASLAEELSFGHNTRSEQLSAEAVAMARRLGDPLVLAHAVHARIYGLLDPATLDEQRVLVAEEAELARRLGDPRLLFLASLDTCGVEFVAGEREASELHLAEMERLATELGQPVPRWMSVAGRAEWETLTGDLDTAERLATQCLAEGQAAGEPDALMIFLAQLFTIRLHQGRLDELEQLVVSLSASAGIPAILPCTALLLLETGRSQEARATLEPLASADFSSLPYDPLRPLALAASAWVAASVGERGWVQVLERYLLPYHGLCIRSGGIWWGPADTYLALLSQALGRPDEADQRFATAAALASRMGSPPWLARIQVEWADLLEQRARADDYDKATMLRVEAVATAKRLGLMSVEMRAQR
jgi:class 3 adenylate cyclase